MRAIDEEHCAETQHAKPQAQQSALAPSIAEQVAQVFRAMADPTRVRILAALSETERCVGDLAAVLDMSVSAISHQLRLLRELRVVRKRRDGKHIYYALDDEHIRDLFERGLEHAQHT